MRNQRFNALKIQLSTARCLSLVSVGSLCLAMACSDDDDPTGNGGSGGSSGNAGSSGSSGMPGGSGGMGGGSSGTGGNMSAGSGGMGMGTGPTGTIQVLNSDTAALLAPTTAAIRGTNVFVAIGQLGELPAFGGDDTPAPFTAIQVPLAGGALGPSVSLPGDDFYPEGIAAADDGTLYVGSINTGAIVQVAATGTTAAAFVAAGAVADRGVVGMVVDDARDLLWFCDSSPNAAGGALVGVDLDDGTETVRHDLPNPAAPAVDADAGVDGGDAGDAGAAAPRATFCNDVRLTPQNDLLVTDSFGGRIFRIPSANVLTANSATVWLTAPEIAPANATAFGVNGLDFVGGSLIVASGAQLFVINPASPATNIQSIDLTLDGAAATLCGPDGLIAVSGTTDQLVVVENGFCGTPAPRVIKITLDLD
jgi:hypothetical protein